MTERIITDALNAHYSGNAKYKLANAYIFKSDWESDFFLQKQNGYCYEFEVKISRGDFFADKQKVSKHLILSTGKYIEQGRIWNDNTTCQEDRWIKTETEKEHSLRPNKFFYVVPTGLITVDELPSYAGLLTYDKGCITGIKEAPFIHKTKQDFSAILCPKFYAYWLDEKINARQYKRDNDFYREENTRLNEKIAALTTLNPTP